MSEGHSDQKERLQKINHFKQSESLHQKIVKRCRNYFGENSSQSLQHKSENNNFGYSKNKLDISHFLQKIKSNKKKMEIMYHREDTYPKKLHDKINPQLFQKTSLIRRSGSIHLIPKPIKDPNNEHCLTLFQRKEFYALSRKPISYSLDLNKGNQNKKFNLFSEKDKYLLSRINNKGKRNRSYNTSSIRNLLQSEPIDISTI